jgi:hypothetical protein
VRSFAVAAMSPSPGRVASAAGTPPLQSALFDQRSVNKENAVSLHQDLLCLDAFVVQNPRGKQHSHRLYYRLSEIGNGALTRTD